VGIFDRLNEKIRGHPQCRGISFHYMSSGYSCSSCVYDLLRFVGVLGEMCAANKSSLKVAEQVLRTEFVAFVSYICACSGSRSRFFFLVLQIEN